MITVDSMTHATREPASVWIEYVSSKERLKNEGCLFCFFEGADRKYYNYRIKNLIDVPIMQYICGNRDAVIAVYQKILSERDSMKPLLFFVDRDYNFDSYKDNEDVYQTPEYSIENFYCKNSVIKEIMIDEFGLQYDCKDMNTILSMFDKTYSSFLDYYACVNVWYLTCKKLNIPVQIKKFKPKNDFYFLDFKIIKKNSEIRLDNIADYYKKLLEKDKLQNKKYSEKNLDEYLEKISVIKKELEAEVVIYDIEKDFRGKFALEFLKEFLGYIKKINKEGKLEKKYQHIDIDEHAPNILSNLSKYAVTPPCLIQYINKHEPLTS